MTEQTTPEVETFDPTEHTVEDLGKHIEGITLDTAPRLAELDRLATAEAEGKNRQTALDLIAKARALAVDAAAEDAAAGEPPVDAEPEQLNGDTTTRGLTFEQAAVVAEPADVGYVGVSPERERTGLADKGLSQANPAIMKGGVLPDPRRGVDDSAALNVEG